MPENIYSGQGSPLPTGRSPLVLDIERNIQSVVQQQVENKKREIADKRLRVTDNEQAILDALDATTIEGVGDKVALDFANEIDKNTEKWARKMAENEGELSSSDKIALNKDKRNIENKLKSQAADIKMMEWARNELTTQAARTDKKGILDYEKTSKWLSEYAKSGKAGSGEFINGLVFAQPKYGEEFVSQYNDVFENFEKSTDEKIKVLNQETGLYETRTTTKDEQLRNFMRQTPWGQREMQQNPDKYAALENEIVQKHTLNKSEQGFSGIINKRDSDGTANERASRDYLNEFVEGVARANPSTLKSIVGLVDKEVGTINNAYYEDGKLYLVPKNTEKYGTISMNLPKANDENSRLTFKKNFLKRFGQVGDTVIERKQLDEIEAFWGDQANIEPDMPISLKTAVSTLSISPEQAIRNNEKDIERAERNKETIPDKITTKDYRDSIISAIKKNVDEVTASESEWKFLRRGGANILEITNKDGNKIEYDLSKESDREKLSDWIVENSKYKEKFREQLGYGTQEQPITETEEIDDPLGIL